MRFLDKIRLRLNAKKCKRWGHKLPLVMVGNAPIYVEGRMIIAPIMQCRRCGVTDFDHEAVKKIISEVKKIEEIVGDNPFVA